MRTRRILRALLLLLLLGAVLMEALFLSRLSFIRWVHDAYPYVGVDRDGEVRYYDSERVERDGKWDLVSRRLDAERHVIDTMSGSDVVIGAWGWPYGPTPSLEPRFLRQRSVPVRWSILETLANDLNRREALRRDITPGMFVGKGNMALETPKPMPLCWQAEAGRLTCRETASGRVLASIGPDGCARGESAGEGEPFAGTGPSVVLGTYTTDGPWPGFALLEKGSRIVALLAPAAPAGPLSAESVEPIELVVEARPLHPDAGQPWMEPPWIAEIGDEILILLTDGSLIGRIRLEAGESRIGTAGDRSMRGTVRSSARPSPPPDFVGISTSLMPSHPATKRIRMRLFRPGRPVVQRDVVLEPTRPTEIVPANIAAALALLRPFPLNAAASLSPLPADSAEALRWWWRDPWLADGSYAGWLVASFALALLCAWRARRTARVRCATAGGVRFWTAAVFLLGPVGLLWMRFVLPRVPVEAVGGARRAVNLDASPSTSTPWPEPAHDGIEVFG